MDEWIVSPEESGIKLQSFLVKHLGLGISAKSIKRAIENNQCRINGRTERFASTLVGRGDCIQIAFHSTLLNPKENVFESSRILFEDKDILVYDKPPGINCDDDGMQKLAQGYCSSLELAHRLDRETTGVLLFAKGKHNLKLILDQFKARRVKKSYLALVDGELQEKAGLIENELGKKRVYQGQTIWGVVPSGGLRAITSWQKLQSSNLSHASLVRCFPKTGRTHQLRVHLAAIGHPILGDGQYGRRFACTYRPKRYLLHAEAINLSHPSTGKTIEFSSPVPADFIEAQNELFERKKKNTKEIY